MQMANIYLWQDREWVITSMSQTTFGVWIANSAVQRRPKECADTDLGEAILGSLNESQTGVPHPTDWKALRLSYVKNLGIKSVDKFELKCRLVGVLRRGALITLTPNKNGGARSGFTPLTPSIRVESPNPDALGKSVRACVERCE